MYIFDWNKKIQKLSPTPGIEPGPSRWERDILATRPYGRDLFVDAVIDYLKAIKSIYAN